MFDSTYAILFCVVYGSLVNFCCAKTFNLADHLSDHEKLELFGSHEVPEHQILETFWSRHRRDDENIVFQIDISPRQRTITLRPTDGLLVAEHTPVWTANVDSSAENGVRYDLLYRNAPKHVGKYRCYHDLDMEAAVTVFYDENNVGTMEGFINYNVGLLVRSLPLTAISEVQDYRYPDKRMGNPWIKVRPQRSVSQDDESRNVTRNAHVIFKMPSPWNDTIKNVERVVRRREVSNSGDSVVYPEILVIADTHGLGTHDAALKNVISEWNAIDLAFSRLTNPRVRLNIGGVILVNDINALEYLPIQDYGIYNIVSRIANFARNVGSKHPVASELNLCDMVMIMVNTRLYEFNHVPGQRPESYSWLDGEVSGIGESCPTTDPNKPHRFYPGVGIYSYDRGFGGVPSGIMQLARLLGSHDDVDNTPGRCDTSGGFAMSTLYYTPHRRKMDWSDCSIDFFRNHLNSPAAACLKNKPRWTVLEYEVDAN